MVEKAETCLDPIQLFTVNIESCAQLNNYVQLVTTKMTTVPEIASTVPTTTSCSNNDDNLNSTTLSTIQLRFEQMNVVSSATVDDTSNIVESVQKLYHDYQRILSVGEECINANELLDLLIRQGRGSSKRAAAATATTTTTNEAVLDVPPPEDALGFRLYDGFEPSGRMHIAQGIYKVTNVNKCTYEENGGTFIFWIADWFALMKYVVA